MPALPQPDRKLTPAQFYAVRGDAPPALRHELVDGELLVTPAPTRRHQSIVLHLSMLLAPYVKRERQGELLFAPFDLRLADSVILQPDMLVIPLDAPYDGRSTEVSHVTLAIEVVSLGSLQHDSVTKRARYQRYGIPEYWLLDGEAHSLRCWRYGRDIAEFVTDTVTWHPAGAREPFTLNLQDFFAALPGA